MNKYQDICKIVTRVKACADRQADECNNTISTSLESVKNGKTIQIDRLGDQELVNNVCDSKTF